MGIQLWDTISAKARLIKSDINIKVRNVQTKNEINDKVYKNTSIVDLMGLKKGPSLVDKVDMLFTDVETEGKKQGYERASKEYEPIYREIENRYKETTILIKSQKNMYGDESYKLIDRLSVLENERESLEKQVDNKAKQLSKTYNIPLEEVRSAMSCGTLLMPAVNFSILDMIYSYKEKKLKKAEQNGYLEAKDLYEDKIKRLKAELNRLKEKGDEDIKKLVDLISDVLGEIVENQMKIAELRILL
ncbi:hypothetical protein [Clostridium tunisiense]|uniref:hypothetical protein n=1 Tax=Clostridium tunisiense TaxID=219748 RepID=UPI000313D4BD|nr:hypothetical protein [Clostridium tunisiense]